MLTFLAEWFLPCGLANALGFPADGFCAASRFVLDQVNRYAVVNLEVLVEREILTVGSKFMLQLAMVYTNHSHDSHVVVKGAEVVIQDFSFRELILCLWNPQC